MSEYNDRFIMSKVASGNMLQYCFVQFSGEDVYRANSGAVCLGVVQDNAQDNEHTAVAYMGSTKIRLAGSLAAGIEVVAGSAGQAVNANMASTVTNSGTIMGLLIQGGTAAGAIGQMIINRR